MSNIKKHLFIGIFLLFYFAINSYKLISHPTPFYDWDESIYVQAGHEMVNAKSFVPLWQGTPWLDKPPIVPLFYGLVEKLFFFAKPEVSLRLVTLFLATVSLLFLYALYLKASKSRLIASVSVIATSFISIFVQRSTAVNIDVFLLLGWVGYVLFFENFYLSLFFLAFSVLSKTLVGFYPTVIMLTYYLFLLMTKKLKRGKFIHVFKKIFFHVAILSFWYLIMLVLFGKAFWIQHIIETHFKRVTSSIEFHFGKRTFYLDLIFDQFGRVAWIGYASLGILFFQFLKKKITAAQLLFGLFLFPWFIFLNLTKTKIFWYAYPVIPQFAFLIAYPLTFVKTKKPFFYAAGFLIVVGLLYWNLVPGKFFQTYYSSFEPHYYLALYAKDNCNSLSVLENEDTRNAFDTLEKMNLLITTSKWWGSRPSIVYYFGKKVHFLYRTDELQRELSLSHKGSCFAIDKSGLPLVQKKRGLQEMKKFGPYFLYKHAI